MSGTNFPNGVSSRGVPLPADNSFAGWWGSNIWFVDGDNGSDSNDGKNPDSAYASVAQAISASAAYDTIYVRPRVPDTDASDPKVYAENQTIPYAKHHLSLISTSNTSRVSQCGAWLKSSAAGYVVDVYASGFSLENFAIHNSAGASGTGGIYLRSLSGYTTAAGSVGSEIVNCFIRYGDSGTEAGVYMIGGYHSVIEGCTFISNVTSIYMTGSTLIGRAHQIKNCNFMSHTGTSTANAMVSLAGSLTEVLIRDCHFDQGTLFIDASGAVDGLVSNCYFQDGAITPSDGGAAIDTGSGSLDIVGCYDQAGIVQEA